MTPSCAHFSSQVALQYSCHHAKVVVVVSTPIAMHESFILSYSCKNHIWSTLQVLHDRSGVGCHSSLKLAPAGLRPGPASLRSVSQSVLKLCLLLHSRSVSPSVLKLDSPMHSQLHHTKRTASALSVSQSVSHEAGPAPAQSASSEETHSVGREAAYASAQSDSEEEHSFSCQVCGVTSSSAEELQYHRTGGTHQVCLVYSCDTYLASNKIMKTYARPPA